jgi:hypothetical protein
MDEPSMVMAVTRAMKPLWMSLLTLFLLRFLVRELPTSQAGD